MASTTVDRVHHGQLAAATVDTVTLGGDYEEVEITNRAGTTEIFVTTDGTIPTVAGAETEVVPARVGAATLAVPTPGVTVVKLISAGTPTYTVAGRGRRPG